jgi:hypothetical protein
MFRKLFDRRRTEPRWRFDIGTTAHEAGGPEIRIRIVSLSTRGFRLKGGDGFREGAELSILLPGYGEVVGRVVWVAGDECGGILQNPIPIDELQLTETEV